jgi:hypothetical protein
MSIEKPTQSQQIVDSLISGAACLCVAVLGWWAFTLELPAPQGNGSLAPRPLLECVMDREGFLRGTLYSGQTGTNINWRGKDLRCDGMFRPDGAGVRIVFDQYLDKDKPGIVLLMGVADARLDEPVNEALANITLIDQVAGRFYTTGDQSRCWTSFLDQQKLLGTSEETWRIDGIIFCQGPLTELRGNGRIQLSEMEFSGLFRPGLDN